LEKIKILKQVFTKEGQVGLKNFQYKMSLKFKNLLKYATGFFSSGV
jgi:hypothetical protein